MIGKSAANKPTHGFDRQPSRRWAREGGLAWWVTLLLWAGASGGCDAASTPMNKTGDSSLPSSSEENACDKGEWKDHFSTETHSLNELSGFTRVHDGNVEIRHFTGIDLKALSCLESVDGSLIIEENDGLVDLRGLENLKKVAGLTIEGNLKLRTLDGLNQIEHLEKGVSVIENPELIELNALESTTGGGHVELWGNLSLQSIRGLRGFAPDDVFIHDHPKLASLSGLEDVPESMYSLRIFRLPLVVSIEPLGALHNIRCELEIRELPQLETLKGLDQLETIQSQCNRSLITGALELESLDALTNLDHLDPRLKGSLAEVSTLKIGHNASLPTCALEHLLEGIQVDEIEAGDGLVECECDGPICAEDRVDL